MAEEKKCPDCGITNISADTFHDWKCHKCGEFIPRPKEAAKNLKVLEGGKG